MLKYLYLAISLTAGLTVFGQGTFPVNGAQDIRSGCYAFTHANIIIDPSTAIQDATLVIRDGMITDVGSGITIPSDAVVRDMQGDWIYPSFIDAEASYGIPAKQNAPGTRGPQMQNSGTSALNWNQAVTPEFDAYTVFSTDTASARIYRNAGFGLLLTHRNDGIMQGTGALVNTGNEPATQTLIKELVSSHYSLRKGSSTQDYPSSQMGSIALLRQTFYDADWYARGGNAIETNPSLDAIQKNKSLIHIFNTQDKLEILRAQKIGAEFGISFIMRGSGNEYQRIQEIKSTGAAIILPLQFPQTPDVTDPYDAELLNLSDLKHWEMAPANPHYLENAGITFCFTSAGLEEKTTFLSQVRKAIRYGLSEKTALEALTTTPAKLLKIDPIAGTLNKGKHANFLITSGNIFDEKTVIYENWVKGNKYEIQAKPADHRGVYLLQTDNRTYGLIIKGDILSPEFSIIKLNDTLKAEGSITDATINLRFADSTDMFRLSGWMTDKKFEGQGQMNARWITWSANFSNVYAEKKAEKKKDSIQTGATVYPFLSYGNIQIPPQQEVLITNATVWTNEKAGVLQNHDVLISNGKILKVGKSISAKNAVVIDGTGKHLTAGIIDEHSHIAVTDGVNEGAQSSSAEVRIGDVINCDDINIYRQLSGGVTTAHILHGSANAVGGQTQLIKLRWGMAPEQMKFENWPGFIKFALGENVKQSNWGDDNTIRFPQTRMGVEQVYEDIFTRALEYRAAQMDKTKNTRVDLELEAIAEILESKRFITCHSYVQSEINMLMKLAERYDFTVNTFTHILEGYKVADKMQRHGAGASSFSDWWAYKYEVYEAIPQNPGILHDAGVVTAINSDDAEMARRLNQEAAKSIKYSGMTEEDALKMVTLNPAILLHIDDRVGSIREGKDADIVLWSDNPLSIYAVAENTFVDGRLYFDRAKMTELSSADATERDRIIRKMMESKNNGEFTIPVTGKMYHAYDCEDVGDYVTGE